MRPSPLLGLAAICAAAVAATYALFVRTGRGQRADQSALDGRGLASESGHHAAQQLLATVGLGTLIVATAVLIAHALVRRRVAASLFAGSAIAGAALTTQLLERLLTRPDLMIDERTYGNSFPSGHATLALAVGMAATLVAPPRLRRSASVLAVLYGSAVGIAVIAAGWHRPSDVAGAYFVATAWAALAGLANAAHQQRRGHGTRSPRATTARNLLGLAAALLTAGYAATLAILAASRSGQVDWTAVDGAFAGACATVAALAALLMAALLAGVTEPGASAGAPRAHPRAQRLLHAQMARDVRDRTTGRSQDESR